MPGVSETAPTAMSDVPEESREWSTSTRWQKIRACLGTFGTFMLGYLISAGPAAWLHRMAPIGQARNLIEILYAPIVFLVSKNVPIISPVMKWYVGLFR